VIFVYLASGVTPEVSCLGLLLDLFSFLAYSESLPATTVLARLSAFCDLGSPEAAVLARLLHLLASSESLPSTTVLARLSAFNGTLHLLATYWLPLSSFLPELGPASSESNLSAGTMSPMLSFLSLLFFSAFLAAWYSCCFALCNVLALEVVILCLFYLPGVLTRTLVVGSIHWGG